MLRKNTAPHLGQTHGMAVSVPRAVATDRRGRDGAPRPAIELTSAAVEPSRARLSPISVGHRRGQCTPASSALPTTCAPHLTTPLCASTTQSSMGPTIGSGSSRPSSHWHLKSLAEHPSAGRTNTLTSGAAFAPLSARCARIAGERDVTARRAAASVIGNGNGVALGAGSDLDGLHEAAPECALTLHVPRTIRGPNALPGSMPYSTTHEHDGSDGQQWLGGDAVIPEYSKARADGLCGGHSERCRPTAWSACMSVTRRGGGLLSSQLHAAAIAASNPRSANRTPITGSPTRTRRSLRMAGYGRAAPSPLKTSCGGTRPRAQAGAATARCRRSRASRRA